MKNRPDTWWSPAGREWATGRWWFLHETVPQLLDDSAHPEAQDRLEALGPRTGYERRLESNRQADRGGPEGEPDGVLLDVTFPVHGVLEHLVQLLDVILEFGFVTLHAS